MIALVVIVTIIVYARYLPIQQRLVRFALGLQLGGAIANNLIDRPRQGHVTDFIYFHFWPAFNIADMAIVSGVLLLAYALLTQKDETPQPAGAEQGDQPTSSLDWSRGSPYEDCGAFRYPRQRLEPGRCPRTGQCGWRGSDDLLR